MATTSSKLVVGKAAIGGRDGRRDSGRFGLRAKLAAGLVTLGCAAALTFGGTYRGDAARPQPQPVTQATQPAASLVDWEQAERGHVAPMQAVAILDWEQQDRTQVAPAQVIAALDWEQAERLLVAPAQTALPLDWEQAERTQVAP